MNEYRAHTFADGIGVVLEGIARHIDDAHVRLGTRCLHGDLHEFGIVDIVAVDELAEGHGITHHFADGRVVAHGIQLTGTVGLGHGDAQLLVFTGQLEAREPADGDHILGQAGGTVVQDILHRVTAQGGNLPVDFHTGAWIELPRETEVLADIGNHRVVTAEQRIVGWNVELGIARWQNHGKTGLGITVVHEDHDIRRGLRHFRPTEGHGLFLAIGTTHIQHGTVLGSQQVDHTGLLHFLVTRVDALRGLEHVPCAIDALQLGEHGFLGRHFGTLTGGQFRLADEFKLEIGLVAHHVDIADHVTGHGGAAGFPDQEDLAQHVAELIEIQATITVDVVVVVTVGGVVLQGKVDGHQALHLGQAAIVHGAIPLAEHILHRGLGIGQLGELNHLFLGGILGNHHHTLGGAHRGERYRQRVHLIARQILATSDLHIVGGSNLQWFTQNELVLVESVVLPQVDHVGTRPQTRRGGQQQIVHVHHLGGTDANGRDQVDTVRRGNLAQRGAHHLCRGSLQIGLSPRGYGEITYRILFQSNTQNILQRIVGITAIVTLYGDGIALSLGQLLTLVEIECRGQAIGGNGPETVHRRLDHDALLHRLTIYGHAESDLQGGVGIDREIGTTPGLGAVSILFHPEHGQHLGRRFHHFLWHQIVGHLATELVDHRLLGHRQDIAIGILLDRHQGIVARRNGVAIFVGGARVFLGVDHGFQSIITVAVGG